MTQEVTEDGGWFVVEGGTSRGGREVQSQGVIITNRDSIDTKLMKGGDEQ